MALLLSAVDIDGPLRWRWLLTDEETGALLADHPVFLDEDSAELERFQNLYGYVRWHAAPDRRVADEGRIVADAAAWAGQELLGGPVVRAVLAAAAQGPVTVRVSLSAALDHVHAVAARAGQRRWNPFGGAGRHLLCLQHRRGSVRRGEKRGGWPTPDSRGVLAVDADQCPRPATGAVPAVPAHPADSEQEPGSG